MLFKRHNLAVFLIVATLAVAIFFLNDKSAFAQTWSAEVTPSAIAETFDCTFYTGLPFTNIIWYSYQVYLTPGKVSYPSPSTLYISGPGKPANIVNPNSDFYLDLNLSPAATLHGTYTCEFIVVL